MRKLAGENLPGYTALESRQKHYILSINEYLIILTITQVVFQHFFYANAKSFYRAIRELPLQWKNIFRNSRNTKEKLLSNFPRI